MPLYDPLPANVRMSDTGFWVVEVEIAPGQRMGVMMGTQATTEQEAIKLAIGILPATGAAYKGSDQAQKVLPAP